MPNKQLPKVIIFPQFTLKDPYHFFLPLQASYTNESLIMIIIVPEPAVHCSEAFWKGKWGSIFNVKVIFVA